MRQTSVEAYNTIKENGLLSLRRWQIYDILFHHGPLTAGEIFDRGIGIVKGSVCARLTELRELGIVSEIGEKKWSSTGHTGILWDVTKGLPVTPEKTESKNKIITALRARVKELEDENISLKHRLGGELF